MEGSIDDNCVLVDEVNGPLPESAMGRILLLGVEYLHLKLRVPVLREELLCPFLEVLGEREDFDCLFLRLVPGAHPRIAHLEHDLLGLFNFQYILHSNWPQGSPEQHALKT